MKKPVKITFDEVMRELEKNRMVFGTRKREFTKQEDALIRRFRLKKPVVSLVKLAEAWEKLGWGRIAPHTLGARAKELGGKK